MSFEKTAKNYVALILGGEYEIANEVRREYFDVTGLALVLERDYPDMLVWEVDGEGNYYRVYKY